MKKIITLISIVFVVISLMVLPLLIKVKIECKSQYGTCPQQILNKINFFSGKKLIIARNGVRKIIKSDFSVLDFSLQFKIPNILYTELLIKRPIAAFKSPDSYSFFLVDKDGKTLSEASESALPVISIDGNAPIVGQNINLANLFALNLATGIYQMYQIRESFVQDGSLLVELPDRIRVIFPLEGEVETLLGSLRLIYPKIKEGGNLAGYSQIDLRYANPVLR